MRSMTWILLCIFLLFSMQSSLARRSSEKSVESNRNNDNPCLSSTISSLESLHNDGLQFFHSQRFGDAEVCFRRLISLAPHSPTSRVILSEILSQRGNSSGADAELQQALTLFPNDAVVNHRVGILERNRGNLDLAEEYIKTAIKNAAQSPGSVSFLPPSFLAQAYMQLGLTFRAKGLDDSAIDAYLTSRQIDPTRADVLVNLGVALLSVGKVDEAEESYKQAINIKPDMHQAYFNLGVIYQEQRRQYDEAIRLYLETLKIAPTFSDAYHTLGTSLQALAHFDQAESAISTAIALSPTDGRFYNSLGILLETAGDLVRAEQVFAIAVTRVATRMQALWLNWGKVLNSLHRREEAERILLNGISINPSHGQAYCQLGDVYKDGELIEDAIDVYAKGVALAPNYDAGYCNFMYALLFGARSERLESGMQRLRTAVDRYIHLLDKNRALPNSCKSFFSQKGGEKEDCLKDTVAEFDNILKNRDPLAHECVQPFQSLAYPFHPAELTEIARFHAMKARRRAQGFAEAALNGGDSGQLIPMYRLQRIRNGSKDETTDSASTTTTTVNRVSDRYAWKIRKPRVISLVHVHSPPQSPSSPPLLAHDDGEENPQFLHLPSTHLSSTSTNLRGLRLGFASGDFGDHPVIKDLVLVFDLLRRHHSHHIQTFCFALNPDEGGVHSVWRKRVAQVCPLVELGGPAWPDLDAAAEINDRNIHVLINLHGYTYRERNEVFSFEPAPVAIGYKGFMGSLGATSLPLQILDKIVAPPELAVFMTEWLIVMPQTYVVNNYVEMERRGVKPVEDDGEEQKSTQPVISREAFNLTTDHTFLLGCFNQQYKVDSMALDAWGRILSSIPSAALWMMRFRSSDSAEQEIRRQLEQRGVEAHQIIFSELMSPSVHLAVKGLADVFVDTFSYNGHGTATDALWAGLPLVTLPGEKAANRVAASYALAWGGRGQISVARDVDDYVAIVSALFRKKDSFSRQLKEKMLADREKMAVFDAEVWLKDFVVAIKATWETRVSPIDDSDALPLPLQRRVKTSGQSVALVREDSEHLKWARHVIVTEKNV